MSSSKIQPGLLRKMTVRKVLECLQQQGPLSRADVTRETGISAPTVSKAVADLLDSGLLEEGEAPGNALGRPGKRLMLARDSAQVIGVVLDSKVCSVVTATLAGDIDTAQTVTFSTPGSYGALQKQLAEIVQAAIDAADASTLGIGISTPGLQDGEQCFFAPNLQAINHQRPAADLAAATGITAFSMQESRALCMAERLYGNASGMDDFAMLDFTNGLGLGVFCGGELIQGHNGLAGEIGHITVNPTGKLCGCGNHGCLETLATDSALTGMISERLGKRLTISEVVEQFQQGTLQATEEVNLVCEYLAIAMAAAINLFNPSTLFVYGQLLSISEGTMEQVIRMTRRRTLDPSFQACQIQAAGTTKQQAAVAAVVHNLTRAAGPRVAK